MGEINQVASRFYVPILVISCKFVVKKSISADVYLFGQMMEKKLFEIGTDTIEFENLLSCVFRLIQ
jgi:hypothetical protein